MKALRLVVMTPLAPAFDGDVESVIVPLPDGWYGVLPGHADFQARLLAGAIVARVEGRDRLLAMLGGTLVVEDDVVTILTGAAALDKDLDTLEREIDDEVRRLDALEQEAEKHFDRLYRELARAFTARGGRGV
jgi:F-type H+-transporting ATPase subunit epsilon